MRWLAGNCGNLEEYGFGVADMPMSLDLMDDAFELVSIDGNILLDEDFMMGIFDTLVRTMLPFEEYLNYMFDKKRSRPVGSRAEEDKICPFRLLKTELFCATQRDVLQSNSFSTLLAMQARVEFRVQFRDKRKAMAKYLKAIKGNKSMTRRMVSREESIAGSGIDATNIISESLHASSTHSLKMGTTIRLDHCAAERQTRANNDLRHQHLLLVNDRSSKKNIVEKPMGTFNLLPPEL